MPKHAQALGQGPQDVLRGEDDTIERRPAPRAPRSAPARPTAIARREQPARQGPRPLTFNDHGLRDRQAKGIGFLTSAARAQIPTLVVVSPEARSPSKTARSSTSTCPSPRAVADGVTFDGLQVDPARSLGKTGRQERAVRPRAARSGEHQFRHHDLRSGTTRRRRRSASATAESTALAARSSRSQHTLIVLTAPLTGGAVVVHRLAPPCCCRRPRHRRPRRPADPARRCSAPRRPPCSSLSFVALGARLDRARGCEHVPERRAVPDPARGRDRPRRDRRRRLRRRPSTRAWPGTDSQSDNLAPTAVYVGFWVGVPFAVAAVRRLCSGCSTRGGRSAARPAGSRTRAAGASRSRCPTRSGSATGRPWRGSSRS